MVPAFENRLRDAKAKWEELRDDGQTPYRKVHDAHVEYLAYDLSWRKKEAVHLHAGPLIYMKDNDPGLRWTSPKMQSAVKGAVCAVDDDVKHNLSLGVILGALHGRIKSHKRGDPKNKQKRTTKKMQRYVKKFFFFMFIVLIRSLGVDEALMKEFMAFKKLQQELVEEASSEGEGDTRKKKAGRKAKKRKEVSSEEDSDDTGKKKVKRKAKKEAAGGKKKKETKAARKKTSSTPVKVSKLSLDEDFRSKKNDGEEVEAEEEFDVPSFGIT